MTIGKHGVLTAEEARALAKVKLGYVDDGRDIGQEKRDQRSKLAAGTFREIAEKFLKQQDRSNRYWTEVRSVSYNSHPSSSRAAHDSEDQAACEDSPFAGFPR